MNILMGHQRYIIKLIPDCLSMPTYARSPEVCNAFCFASYLKLPILLITDHSWRNGDIRVVGGVLPTCGRLEILYDDSWRRVCMNDFSAGRTAVVACGQLGYHGVLEVSSRLEESDHTSN